MPGVLLGRIRKQHQVERFPEKAGYFGVVCVGKECGRGSLGSEMGGAEKGEKDISYAAAGIRAWDGQDLHRPGWSVRESGIVKEPLKNARRPNEPGPNGAKIS